MSVRKALSDAQWERLAPLERSQHPRGPRTGSDRRFIEGVIWVLRTGAPWRDLPTSFGRWSTIYKRFRRWAVAGRWAAVLGGLAPLDHGHDLASFLLAASLLELSGWMR